MKCPPPPLPAALYIRNRSVSVIATFLKIYVSFFAFSLYSLFPLHSVAAVLHLPHLTNLPSYPVQNDKNLTENLTTIFY